jgi:hypothetical protein
MQDQTQWELAALFLIIRKVLTKDDFTPSDRFFVLFAENKKIFQSKSFFF